MCARVLAEVLFFGIDRQLVAVRQQQYLAACRRVGFVYKPEKTVSPTADGEPVLAAPARCV